jgi:hypothetical protein
MLEIAMSCSNQGAPNTHPTGRAISNPLIENLSVVPVRARRLMRALDAKETS